LVLALPKAKKPQLQHLLLFRLLWQKLLRQLLTRLHPPLLYLRPTLLLPNDSANASSKNPLRRVF
jgi:hypothetical protein